MNWQSRGRLGTFGRLPEPGLPLLIKVLMSHALETLTKNNAKHRISTEQFPKVDKK